MSGSAEVLRSFLGKAVKDVYGRVAGTVISLNTDGVGKIRRLTIEHEDGGFSEVSLENIRIEENEIRLIPLWKADAERLCREVIVAQRKLQALDQLIQQGKINDSSSQALRKIYEENLFKGEQNKKLLIEHLTERSRRLEDSFRKLDELLSDLEVQHLTGDMDEEVYSLMGASLKTAFNRTIAEKKDVDAILRFMSPYEGMERTADEISHPLTARSQLGSYAPEKHDKLQVYLKA